MVRKSAPRQDESADICVIHERLKSERERLGLTQPAFAEAAGAKKRTLIDWEKGISSPTAVQLAALAEIGVDVLFVLVGQREKAGPPALTLEQELLLARYAAADDVGRKMAQRLLGPDPDQAAVKKVGSRGAKAA